MITEIQNSDEPQKSGHGATVGSDVTGDQKASFCVSILER